MRRRLSINDPIGTLYMLVIDAEVLTSSDVALVGEVFRSTFDLILYSYTEFEVEDYTYSLNGEAATFSFAEPTLEPSLDPAIEFDFTIALEDGSEMPSNFIEFDSDDREFTLQSSDQGLVGTYEIVVTASSTDERWTDQDLFAYFTLTAEESDVDFPYNISEEDEPIQMAFEYTFEQDLERNNPYAIPFGSLISDVTVNSVVISFENHGYEMIEINNATMQVLVDPAALVDIYHAEVRVTKQNSTTVLFIFSLTIEVVPFQES